MLWWISFFSFFIFHFALFSLPFSTLHPYLFIFPSFLICVIFSLWRGISLNKSPDLDVLDIGFGMSLVVVGMLFSDIF